MYAIILAGGSGTRLWPLSRAQSPKQFINLTDKNLSLFQETLERIEGIVPESRIVVIAHAEQKNSIEQQLIELDLKEVILLTEPKTCNTAPAIGLAAWYLATVTTRAEDPTMVILPSDHFIAPKEAFTKVLTKGCQAASNYGLVTFGIKPDYPETGYGYILCGDPLDEYTFKVKQFVEKPERALAKQYIKDKNYLWNSGMFAFKVNKLIDEYRRYLPVLAEGLDRINYTDFNNLEQIYSAFDSISIDYGLLEKTTDTTVVPMDITWSDVGSWDALYKISPRDARGNAHKGRIVSIDSENTLAISTGPLVGLVGVKDISVVSTEDAFLVCGRGKSQGVKELVGKLKKDSALEYMVHPTVHRPWGSFTVLVDEKSYKVKKIVVKPGKRLSLQSHRYRCEHWLVAKGEGLVTINDEKKLLTEGGYAFIPMHARHRLENPGNEPLEIIEVQQGSYFGEDDIIRYEDDYGRSGTEAGNDRAGGGSSGDGGGGGGGGGDGDSGDGDGDGDGDSGDGDGDGDGDGGGGGDKDNNGGGDASTNDIKTDSDRVVTRNGGTHAASAKTPDQVLKQWMISDALKPLEREKLRQIAKNPEAVKELFSSELTFGTGGLRGIMGIGLNRMNTYTVRRTTQGLANYIKEQYPTEGELPVAIAYDTRRFSREFAREAAKVLAANGIKTLIFAGARPTPQLSFAVRELRCAAGIVITASHNPPEYNGYKVYGPDGGQAVAPLIDGLTRAINAVDIFEDVSIVSEEEARARGLLQIIKPELDELYTEKVSSLSLSRPNQRLKVVFTPLHGTGACFIADLLSQRGYIDLAVAESQMSADPDFSTVKNPNPEDKETFAVALDLARKEDADLVMATDPDCDRLGCAIRDKGGNYRFLTGDQTGALLTEYILGRLKERGELPERGVILKTIVTGDLGKRIAASYDIPTIETLTGFKYIGEKIKEFEAAGAPDFVFGYEESHGYLAGTFVRDKDANIAALLVAEMAAYYKERDQSLLDALEGLFKRFGYYKEDLVTLELKDEMTADRLMTSLDRQPPKIANMPIAEKRDYSRKKGWDMLNNRTFDIALPRSKALYYRFKDGSWFCVRPSGTEPKLKFYFSAVGPKKEDAKNKLTKLKNAVLT